MGPASENAGYGDGGYVDSTATNASMGPTSENAGYGHDSMTVHRPPTIASMGPTSENAGYAAHDGIES